MIMNDCMLAGYVTADPVLKDTKTGKKVCNFTIGVKRRAPRNATPEQIQNTPSDFFRCAAWEGCAEAFAKQAKKGTNVFVRGSININKNESGDKVYFNPDMYVKIFEVLQDKSAKPSSQVTSAENADASAPVPQEVEEEVFKDIPM